MAEPPNVTKTVKQEQDETENTNNLGNVGTISSRPSLGNPGARNNPTNTIRYPKPSAEIVEAENNADMFRGMDRTMAIRAIERYDASAKERQAKLLQDFYANRPLGPVNYENPYAPDAYQKYVQSLQDGRSVITADGKYWANAPDLTTEDDRERAQSRFRGQGPGTGVVLADAADSKNSARAGTDLIRRMTSMDAEDRVAVLAETNPAVLARAAVAGLNLNEIGDVARILALKDVAEAAFTRVSETNGNQAGWLASRQTLALVEDPKDRAVASTFFQDIIDEAVKAGGEAADNNENWSSQAIRMVGTLFTPVVDTLMLGNDFMTQMATAMYNRGTEAVGDLFAGDDMGERAAGLGNIVLTLSPLSPISTLVDGSYGEADKGTLNQDQMNDLRSEYGDFAVDVLSDIYVAFAEGDDDLLERTLAKYENDPNAWALIQQGMVDERIGGDSSISDLYTKIAFAAQDSLGNGIVRTTRINPTSAWATGIRDVTNTTAILVYDPLNALFGAGVALKGAKYGFYLMAKTVNVEKAFSRSRVQNWYNWFGEELKTLKALDEAGDTVGYGRKYTTLRSQSKGKANDETIRIFLKHDITDADKARDFFMSMEAVTKITTGKAATPRTLRQPNYGSRSSTARQPNYGSRSSTARQPNYGSRSGNARQPNYGSRSSTARPARRVYGREVETTTTAPSELAKDAIAAAASHAQAQSAKRTSRIYVPHQYAATTVLKRTIGQVRGAADITKYLARSTPVMDDVLGADWVTLTPSERTARLANVMADDELVDRLAREIGDWAVNAEGAPRRTMAGAILDGALSGNSEQSLKWRNKLGISRSGWAKKGVLRGDSASLVLSRAADRFAAMWARMPDTRGGINTLDARDADKVYQMMRLAGVNRPMASMFRAEWAKMTQAERELAWAGLVRTYGRASGLDRAVLSTDGRTQFHELLEGISGSSMNERYAADSIARYAGIIRDADIDAEILIQNAIDTSPIYQGLQAAKKKLAKLEANPPSKGSAKSIADQKAKVKELEEKWKPKEKEIRSSYAAVAKAIRDEKMREVGLFNVGEQVLPSGSVRQGAVWLSQTNDALAMPNFGAMDQFAARRSYFNALLVNNRAGQTITDLWTFGTLAGPRFQLRNGLEDMALYVLTGGKLGAFAEGRRMSTVIRSATARYSKEEAQAQGAVNAAKKALATHERKGTPNSRIEEDLREKLKVAEEALEKVQDSGAQSLKLGLVNTLRMRLANKLSGNAGLAGRENTLRARIAGAIFMPMTTASERAAAAKGGREAVVALQMKALARQRLLLLKDPEARGIGLRLRRGAEIEDLSPRQQEILRDMEDLLMSKTGMAYEEKVVETSRHLADSVMPMDGDLAPLVKVGNDWYRVTRVNKMDKYVSERVSVGNVDPGQAEAMVSVLHNITADGPRGQAILSSLERYWGAVNKAGGSDEIAMRKAEDEVLAYIKSHEMWYVYRERFRLFTGEDERAFVKNGFQAAVDTFTTPAGKFNKDLLTKLWNPEKKGYSLIDEATGKPVVAMEDFMAGTFKPAYHIVARRSESFLVPADTGSLAWMDSGWAAMGRSLGRMTREPIFKANYLEARKTFRPLQEIYAKQFGEKAGRDWAQKQASERAMQLSMAYVDNPAVRSRVAWRVRNVARFYRAVEDFGRRMYRVAKNDPIAFWRASLLWEATNDSGFTHTDEYGQEYFVYPGSNAALDFFSTWMPIWGGNTGFMIGGKVQWLSPSADPDSWMPTLASPWASLIYRPILRSIGGPSDIFRDVDRQLFGAIGADKNLNLDGPLDGVVGEMLEGIPGALPPILDKLGFGLAAAWGVDLAGTFSFNATAKAAMMLEAQGRGLSEADSKNPKKVEEYANTLRKNALGMTFGMIITGLMAPAAPQLMEDTITKLGRDLETTAMRQAFLRGMKQSMKSEDGIDGYWKWLDTWTRENPDLGIYSMSRTEAAEMGYMEPLEGNAEFAQRNRKLMEQYPIGVSIFGPNTGESTLAAMRVLNMLDVRLPKSLEDQVKELATQNMYIEYNLAKRRFQADVDAAPNEEQRKLRENAMQVTLQQARTMASSNGLSTRLYVNEREQPEYWADRVEEIRAVAQEIGTDGNGLGPDVLAAYEGYSYVKKTLDQLIMTQHANPDYSSQRSLLKETWDQAITTELRKHPGDDQWERILEIMTSALSQGWQLPGR